MKKNLPLTTLPEFNRLHGNNRINLLPFNAYKSEEFGCNATFMPHGRKNFYIIFLLMEGKGTINYADQEYHIADYTICFMNPMVPFSWKPAPAAQVGYCCHFTDEFITNALKSNSLLASSLFKPEGEKVFVLDREAADRIAGIFNNIIQEVIAGYANKYELLRSYVQIIMHEVLKKHRQSAPLEQSNAAKRLTDLFIHLLEKQFSIDANWDIINLRNAGEFANQLSVHTNHLNHVLKETTGKTTSQWLSERITKEAKQLLQYSNLDVSAIGFKFGFRHAANFSGFFKKQTGVTPQSYRRHVLSIS